MEFDASKKTLVIVESPTKANTIRRYLPSNFTVTASRGHIRDLPEDEMGVDVSNGFKPDYVITEGKEKLVKELKSQLKSSQQLLLATDEDREGESISWHLMEVLKPKVPYQRMVFHEITSSAIRSALKSGRDLDLKLVKAQEDRRIIDRLYGYEVSPVLWKRLSNKKLSGGRVQSVGLRFLTDRELDRMNFTSTLYYDLAAKLSSEGRTFTAVLESYDGHRIATSKDFDSDSGAFKGKGLILSEVEARRIAEECRASDFICDNVIQKPSKANPYPPFTTSTLQQAASRRLRISAKETMRIAQSLFENGFITYMRTDSVNLSDECIKASRAQISNDYGERYLSDSERHFANRSLNAQEAHEAIRPAGDSFRRPSETGLSGRELSLYTLIYQRTLATQMAAAEKSTTTVKVAAGKSLFSASGTTILFPGWLKVYGEDESDDEEKEGILPSVTAGEKLGLEELAEKLHNTQPPARYTEASLVKKLEEKGIGRPSTYAAIISTLLDRGYAIEKDRALIPTFLGFAVFNFMEKAFPELIDYSYTARMEEELDLIADGKENGDTYLENFYYGKDGQKGLKEMVEAARSGSEDVKTLPFPSLGSSCTLPDGRGCTYSIKVGPYGTYILTSLTGDNGKALMVNLPDSACPGELKDSDIAALIAAEAVSAADDGSIVLRTGRNGYFWQKGDKRVSVPRGKKKAEDYTEEEIEFLFSLPKCVAHDSNGNEITLNYGPYGAYLSCDGKNYKLFIPAEQVTEEKALELVGKRSSSDRELGELDGRPLAIKRGRYGAYLKWGDENVRLPKGTDVETLDLEKAAAICKQAPSAGGGKVLAQHEDKPVTLESGRFGFYLKWNGRNFRIPRGKNAPELTAEEAVAIVSEAPAAAGEGEKTFGELNGEAIVLRNGKYGYYLKHGRNNIALPAEFKKDPSALTEEKAREITAEKEAK